MCIHVYLWIRQVTLAWRFDLYNHVTNPNPGNKLNPPAWCERSIAMVGWKGTTTAEEHEPGLVAWLAKHGEELRFHGYQDLTKSQEQQVMRLFSSTWWCCGITAHHGPKWSPRDSTELRVQCFRTDMPCLQSTHQRTSGATASGGILRSTKWATECHDETDLTVCGKMWIRTNYSKENVTTSLLKTCLFHVHIFMDRYHQQSKTYGLWYEKQRSKRTNDYYHWL